MKKTAVIILNYNGLSDTLACFKSLLMSEEQPDWIVVVDNASEKTSRDSLLTSIAASCKFDFNTCLFLVDSKSEFSDSIQKIPATVAENRVFFIQSAENKGYSWGNNLGIILALQLGADAVWLLNNDAVVAPDALTHMRERLFSCARPGLCGSLIRYMDQPDFVQCLAGGHTNRWTGLSYLIGHKQLVKSMQNLPCHIVEKRLNFIYGASVMASRDFLTTVGLLDESYFMYCEEQDWAFRAAGRFDLVYAKQAHVWHKEGASTGWPKQARNFFAMRQLFRSRLLLTAKHTPLAMPLVLTFLGYALLRLAYRRLFKKYRCIVPGSKR